MLFKSDRRGSNPRPRPWQGRALPAEPLSHFLRSVDRNNTYYTTHKEKCQHLFLFFYHIKMSTLNSTFFHVFIVLPFCTIRSLFYCIFSLLGSAIVRLPLLPTSHAPYFRSYASCFTSSSNSSPAE